MGAAMDKKMVAYQRWLIAEAKRALALRRQDEVDALSRALVRFTAIFESREQLRLTSEQEATQMRIEEDMEAEAASRD
jgi:hypothetical protein